MDFSLNDFMGNMLQFRYLGPQTAFKLTQLLPTTPLLPGSEQYVAVMRCELVIMHLCSIETCGVLEGRKLHQRIQLVQNLDNFQVCHYKESMTAVFDVIVVCTDPGL